ncbi:MAG TPA: TetR/AcrR family transcriptional regulator C-terminal domain-containing protein [Coriobacteriia bacterium]|nr:TetR/AcrR family transcriptional regulator C-terminal domain-containing protein [Coriobacteriia bacterium]
MATKRTTPLTPDEIFAKALEIIDAEGEKALSMRRLAAELGVEAMSLYHHVANKDAVLAGVVNLALATPTLAHPATDKTWQAIVVSVVLDFRAALVAHPNVLPLITARPPEHAPAKRVYIGAPLQFLLAQGFSEECASQLFEAALAMSFGHAMLTVNYRPIENDGLPTVTYTEASFERGLRALITGYEPVEC